MQRYKSALVGVVATLLLVPSALAATTGKIAGRVTDAATGDPIPMVQVILTETGQGTITDVDGYYAIINVRPGTYEVSFRFVGYAETKVQNVQVEIDETRTIDVQMQEEVIEGQEVVVTAERPLIEMGRTTTTSYVDERQMEALPVANVGEVVNLQAGVVDGHFRGGREGEVMYLINGVPINNPYNNSAAFTIEKNMVQGLEVISGVFGAEYGQAMSGVVNVVTKSVPNQWTGELSAETGGILSNREIEFVNRTTGPGSFLSVDNFESEKVRYTTATGFPGRQDVQLRLGGPIIGDRLGLNVIGRYWYDEGTVPGRRLFMPGDSSLFVNAAPRQFWLIESTGDGEFWSGYTRRWSVNSSLTYRLTNRVRVEYNAVVQLANGLPSPTGGDNFAKKYVPDGINRWSNTDQFHLGSLHFTLSNNSFANFNYSFMSDEGDWGLYDIPESYYQDGILDRQYVSNSMVHGANSFNMRGNDLNIGYNSTRMHTIMADYTNQINRMHQIKTGVMARLHHIDTGNFNIEIASATGWEPVVWRDRFGRDTLDVNPYELAAYVQDKMEFRNLIVNAGVRFDLFEPDFLVPVDWASADEIMIPNLPEFVWFDEEAGDSLFNRRQAPVRWQVSPRIGIAFPISANGVIRFSSGLFFQTPRLDWLYRNHEYENSGGSEVRYGNPSIDPERTLHFEIGLQQGITEDLRVELTLFAKDIRNLSGESYRLNPNGTMVRRLINVDVGSARGLTLELDQRPVSGVSWSIDYTLQFASGTASRPEEAFQRFQSGIEDVKTMERLEWDRRHVLNNYVTVEPSSGFAVTLINRFRTGTPYTTVRNFIRSYIVNNYDRPSGFTSDLRLYWSPPIITNDFQFQLQVDNIFDAKIHNGVYGDTGRADESVQAELFRRNGTPVGGLNSLDEFFYGPDRFSSPRRVTLGARYRF